MWIDCTTVVIVDGDTLRCNNQRMRLLGIDAPELPGHCARNRVCTPGDGHASRAALQRLTALGPLSCEVQGQDRYERALVRCTIGTVDLSCEMVSQGQAVLRYAPIRCP